MSGFPQKAYLQNANVGMNNVLNPEGSKKCKRISEIAEKPRITVKKRENQVILYSSNSREMDTFKKLTKNMQ